MLLATAYLNEISCARVLFDLGAGIIRSSHPRSSITMCDDVGSPELTRAVQNLEKVPIVTGYMPPKEKTQEGLAPTAMTSTDCNPMSRNDAHVAVTLPTGAEPFGCRYSHEFAQCSQQNA